MSRWIAACGRITSRFVLRAAAGLAVAFGVTSLRPQVADAQVTDPSYIYGIADNNDIYQINPVPGEQSFAAVYNTGLSGQSNAFAFDRDRDQMFFINPSGTFNGTPYTNGLFLWNKPAGTFALLATTGSSYGVAGPIPANASYDDNAFWFFNEGTLNLVRATLSYSGTGAAAVPTGVSSFTTFTMDSGTSFTATQNRFGDIAINVAANTLYGYTSQAQGGRFYSLDLADPASPSSFTLISGSSAIGLQLSFNEDYTKLYGHNYNDGKWYEVSTANGSLTDLNFATTTNGTTGFRDLGGASVVSVPEPAAVALVMAGGVAIGARRLGRRPRIFPVCRGVSPSAPMRISTCRWSGRSGGSRASAKAARGNRRPAAALMASRLD